MSRHIVTRELCSLRVPKRRHGHHHIANLTKLFVLILLIPGTVSSTPVMVTSVFHHPVPSPFSVLPFHLITSTIPNLLFLILASFRVVQSVPPQDVLIKDIMASNMTSENKFKAVLKLQHRRYCQTSRTCLGVGYGQCGYCRPCQCDERCLHYGDCCPDKLMEDVEVVQPLTIPLACRDNLYSGYTEEQLKSRQPNATSFLMTASCPPSAAPDLARQCSLRSNYRPVSVLVQGEGAAGSLQVFANTYCAQCHAVDTASVVPWKILLHCQSQRNFTSMEGKELAQEAAEDSDCFLLYFPPPSLPSPRQCYYDDTMITSCNVTGAWPEHDPFTERACTAYLDPKMAEGRLFQNVFCYMCNAADPQLFSLCERSPGIAPMPFSALLDFSGAVYGESRTSAAVKCAPSEIYDEGTEQCRRVLCAPGRQYIDGQCCAVFDSARSLTYSLYFTAILDTDVDLYDGNDLLHRLPGRLETLLLFEMLQESVRPTSFQVTFAITDEDGRCSQKSGQFSVFCTFKVMRDSRQDDFEQLLLQVRNTSASLRLTSQLLLSFTTEEDEHVWLRQQNSANQKAGRSCSTTVSKFYPALNGDAEAANTRVTQLLPLPKVALTQDEFRVQTADLGLKVPWMDEPIPLGRYEATDEGNVYIAVEDFLPKITAYRQGQREADEVEVLLSIVCTALSLGGLAVTLLTYCLFRPLRTAPGRNNMTLCLALFLAQFCYLVGSGRDEAPGLCQAMGIVMHYFWLAAFLAMTVCSYHMWRVFTSLRPEEDGQAQRRRFLHYTLFIWTSAAGVVVVTLFLHMIATGGQDIGYGGQYCYLSTAVGVGVAMGVPVALALAVNATCFALTVRTIRQSPKLLGKSREEERHVWVYLKLSTLTGITWLLAFLVFFTQVAELRYLFTLVNGLQGLFVCLSFVCNRRVARLYLDCCKGGHSGFSSTTSAHSSTSSRSGHVSTISQRTETSFTDPVDTKPYGV